MEAKVVWKQKMFFNGEAEGHSIGLDANPPFGDAAGFTPKALVAIGAAGCTAMDVAALMKKHKQPVESFEVRVDAPAKKAQPPIFNQINLTFDLKGNLDKEKVIESVQLSQSKYCVVSAMLYKTVPIHYKILLNGEQIGTGETSFN